MLKAAAINCGGLCRLYGAGAAKRDAAHVIGGKKGIHASLEGVQRRACLVSLNPFQQGIIFSLLATTKLKAQSSKERLD